MHHIAVLHTVFEHSVKLRAVTHTVFEHSVYFRAVLHTVFEHSMSHRTVMHTVFEYSMHHRAVTHTVFEYNMHHRAVRHIVLEHSVQQTAASKSVSEHKVHNTTVRATPYMNTTIRVISSCAFLSFIRVSCFTVAIPASGTTNTSHTLLTIATQQDGRVDRVSVCHFGRLGNPNVAGSKPG